MSQYKIEAGTGQHVGDRADQQDRVALFTAPKAPGYMMAILADGMGGAHGGVSAAEQVIRTAKLNFERFSPQTEKVETMLETIAQESHTIIKLSAFASEKQPHSTMVVLVITPAGTAMWASVGDSRLYRFDGPNCAEHTLDGSMTENSTRDAKPKIEDIKKHRLSNLIVNVLGYNSADLVVTRHRYDGLKPGDSFLLCSDGLWHYFDGIELGAAISMNTPRLASEMLISKARERASGSMSDNCTLAIVKLVHPPEEVKNYTAQHMKRAV